MSAALSDKELRQQALRLTDPYKQPSLAWEIPANVQLLDILNIYTFDGWPEEKVYCVHCRGRHHKKGFTAVLTNGNRVLLGSKCGATLFGQTWDAAEERMNERADRRWELDRLDRMRPMLASFQRLLPAWRRAADKVIARRNTFHRQLGELASRVSEAAHVHNGKLTAVRQVSQRPSISGPAGVTSVRYEIAELPGVALFKVDDPLLVIDEAAKAVEVVTKFIPGTDGIGTSSLRRARRRFEDTFDLLEATAEMCEGAEEFFTHECFALLVEWMNEHVGTREPLRILEDGIDYRDGRHGVRLPSAPLPMVDTTILRLIREYRAAE